GSSQPHAQSWRALRVLLRHDRGERAHRRRRLCVRRLLSGRYSDVFAGSQQFCAAAERGVATRGRRRKDDHSHGVWGLLQREPEHTSELQSPYDLVCRLLLEKKKKNKKNNYNIIVK